MILFKMKIGILCCDCVDFWVSGGLSNEDLMTGEVFMSQCLRCMVLVLMKTLHTLLALSPPIYIFMAARHHNYSFACHQSITTMSVA